MISSFCCQIEITIIEDKKVGELKWSSYTVDGQCRFVREVAPRPVRTTEGFLWLLLDLVKIPDSRSS